MYRCSTYKENGTDKIVSSEVRALIYQYFTSDLPQDVISLVLTFFRPNKELSQAKYKTMNMSFLSGFLLIPEP